MGISHQRTGSELRVPTDERTCDLGSSFGWLFIVVAAVLYGSLIPLDFDPGRLHPWSGLTPLAVALAGATQEDLITNVLIYVPIGLAAVLCIRRWTGALLTSMLAATLLGAATSLFAEGLQTALASRVASWLDVELNIIGTALGALLGSILYGVGTPLARRLRPGLVARPFSIATLLLTIGLFLYHVAPFDFVLAQATLHSSLEAARWDLSGVRLPALGDPPLALLAAQLTAAVWFALLGFAATLAGRESGRPPASAFLSSVWRAGALIALVECLELLTLTQGFDLATVMLRMILAVLGAWTAIFLCSASDGSDWREHTVIPFSKVFLMLAGAFQVVMLFLATSNLLHLPQRDLYLPRVWSMPFEAMWTGAAVQAIHQVASTLISYGALAVTLSVLLMWTRRSRVWLTTGIVVALVAIGAEGLHGVTVSGVADSTEPILAVLAVLVCARISALLRPVDLQPRTAEAQR